MSFLSGSRPKDRDLFGSSKHQFYVEFLGWMECRGLQGEYYTDPVIRELQRRQQNQDDPPKLTIQVSRKELKITQEAFDAKKRTTKKIKFPTIPATDVTYSVQSKRRDGRLDDIVACIYLGFMPRTRRYVHVHVYRFDSSTTATNFVSLLSQLTAMNKQRILEEEAKLAEWGEIDHPYRRFHDDLSDSHTGSDGSSHSGHDPSHVEVAGIESDLQSLKDVCLYDSVADELRTRLGLSDVKDSGPPILLPPKDYDTISRAHGNLIETEKRRLKLNIVGGIPTEQTEPEKQKLKSRISSGESGVDLHSPSSSENSSKITIFSSENNSPNSSTFEEFSYPPRSPNVMNRRPPLGPRLSAPYSNGYPPKEDPWKNYNDDLPPEDYDNSPDLVELRRPYGGRHTNLSRSLSPDTMAQQMDYEAARRLKASNNSLHSPAQIRRSHDVDRYMDRRQGDFNIRRVNSMYR